MRDRCPQKHKHLPKLLEALWRTKKALVPMLCEPSAPRHSRHEPMLVEAFAHTKALLRPMVYQTGAQAEQA